MFVKQWFICFCLNKLTKDKDYIIALRYNKLGSIWMASTTTSTNGYRTGEEPMGFIAVYEKDGSWVASW